MPPWKTPLDQKSSPGTIRERFESDVERFSSLETGQAATVDAVLAMELITDAAIATAAAAGQPIARVLDIGCGAGNNTLKLHQSLAAAGVADPFDAHLLDLSPNMLATADRRLRDAGFDRVRTIADDFRTADLEDGFYDVILAAAVLHHLRDDADWLAAFERLHALLRPGGSVWITDLVAHETVAVDGLMWDRYDDHLRSLGGVAMVEKVRAYVDLEDSPRPVTYQLELLRRVGFADVELLHKSSCFAAFGAVKHRE